MKKVYGETLRDLIERVKSFQSEYDIHKDAMMPLLVDLYENYRQNRWEVNMTKKKQKATLSAKEVYEHSYGTPTAKEFKKWIKGK